jgi:hypothetical protein
MQLEIGQVNRAVNHVADGEPTLIQQVGHIRSCVTRLTDRFEELHHRIGTLESVVQAQPQPD